MSAEPLQSILPLVDKDGKMTQITEETLLKLVREVQALRAEVTSLDARVTTLEP